MSHRRAPVPGPSPCLPGRPRLFAPDRNPPAAPGLAVAPSRPHRPRSGRPRPRWLLLGWFLGPAPTRAWPPPDWAVALCDVGQGTAGAVRSGPDRAILLDTGPEPKRVDRCLRRLGVDTVDLIVLSHFHTDHVAGLPGVFDGRPPSRLLWPQPTDGTGNVARLRRWAAQDRTQLSAARSGHGERLGTDGWTVDLQVLWTPGAPAAPGLPEETTSGNPTNDDGLVVAVTVRPPGAPVDGVGSGRLELTGSGACSASSAPGRSRNPTRPRAPPAGGADPAALRGGSMSSGRHTTGQHDRSRPSTALHRRSH
jgi:hypothetical protein